MFNPFVFLFFFILSLHSFSQSFKKDSVWKVWTNTSNPDTVRLQALNNVIWGAYLYMQPDSAFHLAQNFYNYSKLRNLKAFEAQALNTQGVATHLMGNTKKGIEYILKSLELREEINDKYGIAMSLNNIGNLYQAEGNYARAIDYYLKSLKIKESIKDDEGVAMTLDNIGVIYYTQKEFDKAIQYCEKSLLIYKKLNYKRGIASSMINLANSYEERGDTVKAMKYYQNSLRLRQEIGDLNGVALCYNNIAYMLANKKQFKQALDYQNKSLKINQDLEDKSGQTIVLSSMGSVFKDMGDFNKAIEYGKQALAIANEIQEVEGIKNASDVLYKSFIETKSYKEALDMHLLYIKMKDSVQNEESKSVVIAKDLQYNYEKQNAIDELKHEKEISRKNSLLIFFFILFAFIFFLYNRNRLLNRNKILLEKDLRNKAVFKAQEEEKGRLSKELHDSLGSLLSLIKLNASGVTTTTDNQRMIHEIKELASEGMKEVRAMSYALMPALLQKSGLHAALTEFVSQVNQAAIIKVELTYSISQDLSDEYKVNIYRIVQEATNNAIKHAAATNILIKLIQEHDKLELLIFDNGKGFSPDETQIGNGLNNILSRVEILKGEYKMISKPENGTKIIISIPINKEQKCL